MVIVVCAATFVGGCSDVTPPSTSASKVMVSSVASPAALTADAVADAIAFRKAFVLRADEAWVRHVAADPRASTSYGVPLMLDEEAVVAAKTSTPDGVRAAITTYAQSQPDYAGIRKDYLRGGMPVVYFAGRLDEHRADLTKLLPVGTTFDVVLVKFSWDELHALQDRIVHDSAWMTSIAAYLEGVGIDPERNLVKVEISSANAKAATEIADHYNAQDRIYVVSDGLGTHLLPTGTLVVRAVDARGRPLAGLIVLLEGDVSGSGIGDVGLGTGRDGEWRGDVISIGYTVKLNENGQDIAKGHVIVIPHQVTTITLVVR